MRGAMFTKSRLKFGLLVTASLALAACMDMGSFGGGNTKAETSEDLLGAEGTWHLVEEKRVPSPAQQHAAARKAVDPDEVQNSAYTSRQKPQMMASGEDIHFRLLRMEREVQSLRADFNKLLPPLKELLISDAQLENAIRNVENAQGVYAPQPASSMSAPAPAKTAAKTIRRAPAPAASTGPGVRDVRVGQHPGKTRLVLDLSQKSNFTYDLDNNEKLLLIDLPSTPWSAKSTEAFSKDPLIARYNASDNGNGGTMLAIQLKRPARILEATTLAPNSTYGNHRIMLDIAPL